MLSLKLCLDLLRLFLAAATQVDEDCFAWADFYVASREIPISFSGSNSTPFSENANTPTVERFVILFWRYLSCHRYPSFYLYAGHVGKKVCSYFNFSSSAFHISFPLRFPLSHDAARIIRWFWVFVGIKMALDGVA